MAPEQLEGREAEVRSDIWAFGCVLYEMLTACPPFEAATQAGLIFKVSARGGTPAQVTTLDPSRQDQAHRWPQFLPGGRHFIYMPWTDGRTNRPIQLAALDGTPPRTLFEAQSAAVVAGDYLLYAADMPSRLMGRGFDLNTLQAQGTEFTVVADQGSAGRIRATAPQALFSANVEQGRTIRNQHAVSPDGQRFLILSAVNAGASPIVAVLNWRSLIRR